MLSQPDREDLRQEGDIASWQAESTWDGSCPLGAWKATSARWAMLDYARDWSGSRRIGKHVQFSYDLPSKEKIVCEPRLYRAIGMLSPAYQKVIKYKFWEGMTHPEIAEELNMSHLAVEAAVSRALQELRRTIKITPICSRESSRVRYWTPPEC